MTLLFKYIIIEEQTTLRNDLELVIKGTGTKDIVQILEEAKTEDLFAVFKLYRGEKGDEDSPYTRVSLLFDLLGKNKICESAVFDMVKKRNILKEFLSIDLSCVKSDNGIREDYRMADIIVKSSVNITEDLDLIKDKFGLKEFWKALPEDSDRNMIKGALKREMGKLGDDQEKSKYKNFLEEISIIESEQAFNTRTLRGMERTLDFGDNRELRKNAVKKGMKFGAIGGAITALAVGLGLYFGTGAALTALPTIIGIALVAALLVGATIGAITYDVLKPKSCIDTVYTTKGFDTVKQETNTATGISV
ncbi:hypothetical protein C1A_1031 [Wolbachia endosymbiont of Culex quinquefasciatus JHB]|uniref:hypothetical protein n=1 Tax=Wolbachia endosymbiont of Culex quinquefasciatus TaxID=263437 RepID=UPI0001761C8D|nr:hypothetical protein [Wolbachia endosymbiont of Culex quinquefasciatus]EEB56009.1 hypothetical protein C1A_1031 [Wolbachia endosymbiont of Culex quinquefasciatus JHB]CAQ54133.1 Hypothetical protein WP0024 [Wolbachia endosymbiont of Culex quinquefasciatus Pel]